MCGNENLGSVSSSHSGLHVGTTVWINAHLATLAEGAKGLGIIENGAVATKDGRVSSLSGRKPISRWI